MNIPGLGKVTKGKHGDYRSKPIPVPVLGGKKCRIGVEGYDEDPDKEAFHVAIANFLSLKGSVPKEAELQPFVLHSEFDLAEVDPISITLQKRAFRPLAPLNLRDTGDGYNPTYTTGADIIAD